MKVYVAAASSEITRAEHCMTTLREAGIPVTSTWPEVIRKVGEANPMGASRDDRMGWSMTDLDQVASASVFWLLLPPKGVASDGAFTEFGYALMLGALSKQARLMGVEHTPMHWILCSGTERSIFTALADHFPDDRDAFHAIKRRRDLVRSLRPVDAAQLDLPTSDGG